MAIAIATAKPIQCPECPRVFEKEKEREMHLKYYHHRNTGNLRPDSLCPQCSCPLTMQEGCRLCPTCGWSKC